MKKIKKLLCSASLGLVVTASPIIMSSCSEPITPIEMVEVKDGHTYPFEPADTNYYTMDTITDLYKEQITQVNPDIFREDATTGAAKWKAEGLEHIYVGEYELDLTSYQVGYSQATIRNTRVMQPGIDDIFYPTISFTQRYVFNYQNVFEEYPENVKIDRTIEVNVEYHDVIFSGYYTRKEAPNTWHIGLFDKSQTNPSMMFWPHINNINPWSINLSCTDSKHIVVRQEDKPDDDDIIEINNCQYYTQTINLASQLAAIYELTHPTDPTKNTEISQFEKILIDHVVLWDYESTCLKNQILLPAIEIDDVTNMFAEGNKNNKEVTFKGLKIRNLGGDVTISSMKIIEDLKFPCFEGHNSISVANGAPLSQSEGSVTFQGNLDTEITTAGETTFSCDRKSIDLEITYMTPKGGLIIKQRLYLPQPTLELTIS